MRYWQWMAKRCMGSVTRRQLQCSKRSGQVKWCCTSGAECRNVGAKRCPAPTFSRDCVCSLWHSRLRLCAVSRTRLSVWAAGLPTCVSETWKVQKLFIFIALCIQIKLETTVVSISIEISCPDEMLSMRQTCLLLKWKCYLGLPYSETLCYWGSAGLKIRSWAPIQRILNLMRSHICDQDSVFAKLWILFADLHSHDHCHWG